VELVRTIHRFKPDVVHVQQGYLWFNFGLPALRSYPLVLTIHDVRHHLGDKGAYNTPQWVFDFGFRLADRVIVHGEALRRKVARDLAIAPDRVHVMPHILLGDPGSYPDVAAEPATILFFGRIWEYKGLEYLIRAEPLISKMVPEVKFVIAGQGEDFAKYRRAMVHPERFVVRNTYVPDDLRDVLFRQATVVVLPYVEASQSGVIPLAYTFEKPVVATTVGALPDIVDDGQTGLLVPPADVDKLATAIVRLLRDEPLRRRLGRNGRRKLVAECSPDIVAAETLAAYRMALRTDRSEHRLPRRPGAAESSEYEKHIEERGDC
jgi:glycosyltransferase involved in cell wall biosynthesis